MQSSQTLTTKSGSPQPVSGPMTVRAIQARLGAALTGDGDAIIASVNVLELAAVALLPRLLTQDLKRPVTRPSARSHKVTKSPGHR